MTAIMIGMFILSIGYIFFPKYMRLYKTYDLFATVPEETTYVTVVKRFFGIFLFLFALLLLLNHFI